MVDRKELKDTELVNVVGGKSFPEEIPERGLGPDPCPEHEELTNLTDNKGADE